MAFTYNGLLTPAAFFNFGNSDDTTSADFDMQRWGELLQAQLTNPAVQLPYPRLDPVVDAAEHGMKELNKITTAALRLMETQAMINIHVLNDNFIRDNITAK